MTLKSAVPLQSEGIAACVSHRSCWLGLQGLHFTTAAASTSALIPPDTLGSHLPSEPSPCSLAAQGVLHQQGNPKSLRTGPACASSCSLPNLPPLPALRGSWCFSLAPGVGKLCSKVDSSWPWESFFKSLKIDTVSLISLQNTDAIGSLYLQTAFSNENTELKTALEA